MTHQAEFLQIAEFASKSSDRKPISAVSSSPKVLI
jgi:hypothetical protein